LRRCLQHRDADSGEHLVEDGGELGVPVADEESERRCSLAEVDPEVDRIGSTARCLR
jgi:hypothetical protein